MEVYKIKMGHYEYQIVASNGKKAIELAMKTFTRSFGNDFVKYPHGREHPECYIQSLQNLGSVHAIESENH